MVMDLLVIAAKYKGLRSIWMIAEIYETFLCKNQGLNLYPDSKKNSSHFWKIAGLLSFLLMSISSGISIPLCMLYSRSPSNTCKRLRGVSDRVQLTWKANSLSGTGDVSKNFSRYNGLFLTLQTGNIKVEREFLARIDKNHKIWCYLDDDFFASVVSPGQVHLM